MPTWSLTRCARCGVVIIALVLLAVIAGAAGVGPLKGWIEVTL